MQEKLGIDDAALVMPIGGGGGGGGGAAAVEEEAPAEVAKTHFEIKLEKFDAKAKIKIIKEVRGLTGLGLKEVRSKLFPVRVCASCIHDYIIFAGKGAC